ncbi:unnamed protein product [Cuscuta epithymum]|uniref:Uncharacterized protein n=1 Tax=Cuscuta epithymum TaxID=186058 RepID=A0AAV0GDI7_9ASTE|nr:unnamed protein product [Cuscuta epithymum]
MVLVSNGGLSHQNQKRNLDSDYHSSSFDHMAKYKTRKVSAVRDFPPGCGRNVSQTDLTSDESVAAETAEGVNTTMGYDSSLKLENKSEEPMKESDHDQMLNQDFAKDLDEIVKLPIVEGVSDGTVPPETDLLPKEDDNNKVEPMEGWGQMIQNNDLKLPIVEGVVESSHDEVVLPGAKVKVKEEEPSVSVLTQKKYCSRRVSAVRDFPPFCGRNAPNLIDGSSNTVMKVLTDKAMASIEEPRGAHHGDRKGITVHNSEKEVVNNCMLPDDDDDDAVGLLRESVTLSSSDIEEKSEMYDAFGSGNVALRSVVVQALMAEPLCPWSQGGSRDFTGLEGMKRKVEGEDKQQHNATSSSSSYRKRYSAVAKKSGLKKATHFSIGAREGAVTKIPVNSEDDGASLGKVRKKLKKFNTISLKDGLQPDVCKKALHLKKRLSISNQITDGGECAFFDDDDADQGEASTTADGRKLPKINVTLPPIGPSHSNYSDARSKVKETLRLFQVLCRKVLQGEESKPKPDVKRIDIVASKIIKEKGKEVNTGKLIVGEVPGVEVGDEFQYRVELALIGVHRLYQAGIDSMKHVKTGMLIAVSIVASGAYADEMDDPDVLVYSGQGGNVVGKVKTPEDQKLERGNLALRNSISVKNPVRVIRGFKEAKPSESGDARSKVVTTYVYDGLYTVANYWSEEGKHGKMVFMFELRRIPGQPELFWKEVKSSKKSTIRRGVCVDDITGGKELLPICAINRIDSEKPPPFKYILTVKYPEWFRPSPPKGCDCPGKCSDSRKCLCAVRNGGELPYNRNGAIVEVKPLVYECGPHCKCPPSCYNRVSQNGIKIQLEIFKTESRGWGVRSLTSIPSGTFICEYAGELLEDREAERRVGIDEYLFDIGHNNSDSSIQTSTNNNEAGEDVGYTIDAAEYGNVGRFINHSCSPNLYAQNVLYDYEDKKMPHIMLFAADNIPPLRELTYHYNYTVDQVRDSSGNIKVKKCFCGSAECSGRLY